MNVRIFKEKIVATDCFAAMPKGRPPLSSEQFLTQLLQWTICCPNEHFDF